MREKTDINSENNSLEVLKIFLNFFSRSNKPFQIYLPHVKLPSNLDKYLERREILILILNSAPKAKAISSKK